MPDESVISTRREYAKGHLRRKDLAANPFQQFHHWFEDARRVSQLEPNAMVLATADAQGQPSARMVLLKEFDLDGFVFATNYQSRKGQDLLENPRASLLFYWPELERQVRIEGEIEKTTEAESDEIFAARPAQSRIAAGASHQSEPIESRERLDDQFESQGQSHPNGFPRPSFWGGYRLKAARFEYWQGGINRMHDRFEYIRVGDAWRIERLQP
jgi:pyridoxamine 5'-phosphate oxidase